MATAKVVDVEYNLTECPVCHETFTDPKLLPCSHILCRHCLIPCLQSQPNAACPICLSVIVDPVVKQGERSVEEVADGFPTDLAMTATMDAAILLSKQHVCCVCVDVAAVALCLQCGDTFCQHCSNVHKKQSLSKHHEVEKLSSLTVDKLATHHPATCPEHPEEISKVYCPNHDTSLCVLCATTAHRNCPELVSVKNHVGDLSAEMNQLDDNLARAMSEADKDISLLDKYVQELQRQSHIALDEMKTVWERLKTVMDARLKQHTDSTLKIVSCVSNKANDIKKYFTQRRYKILSHKNMADRYKLFAEHKYFKDMVTLVKGRIEELDKDSGLPDSLLLNMNHRLITIINPKAVADIEMKLSRLGDVTLTPYNKDFQEAFLNSWFPNLDNRSYFVPVSHHDRPVANCTESNSSPANRLTLARHYNRKTKQNVKMHNKARKICRHLFSKLKKCILRETEDEVKEEEEAEEEEMEEEEEPEEDEEAEERTDEAYIVYKYAQNDDKVEEEEDENDGGLEAEEEEQDTNEEKQEGNGDDDDDHTSTSEDEKAEKIKKELEDEYEEYAQNDDTVEKEADENNGELKAEEEQDKHEEEQEGNGDDDDDHTSTSEVMVMITQASFSMYNSLVTAVIATSNIKTNNSSSTVDVAIENHERSEMMMIINRNRGVLLGLVDEDVISAKANVVGQDLEESEIYLAEAARIVQEVLRTVPGADNVAVHTTLVLPNITRSQLARKFKKAAENIPCLCKNEMDSGWCLEHWWEACWSSGQVDIIDRNVYRHLVARFAIPATSVEVHLTTQPRLHLTHDQGEVNCVDHGLGAEVFQAGLHQLSLFPSQAQLLDVDCLDETQDDFRFLWGPPGTGKTILLVLRTLQWVKYFSAQHIVILQTSKDGTAASSLVEYQLQQTLNAQQQRAQQSGTDTQSAQCTFTHVDMSELWSCRWSYDTCRYDVLLKEGWKEKLYTALGLQQRGQSDDAIHIVADEATGDVVAAVYQWLKEEGVQTVRLWAATVGECWDRDIFASLQHALCHVTEPLRCPGTVVEEVLKMQEIQNGDVPRYTKVWNLTGGPPAEVLRHYDGGRKGHNENYPWRCGLCARNIVVRLKSLRVGEADEGRQGWSANDVIVLGSCINCDESDDVLESPAPLINVLQDNGYNVRKLTSESARDVVALVAKNVKPPAITVANVDCARSLERKLVVCFDEDLVGFSRTTSKLIYIKTD